MVTIRAATAEDAGRCAEIYAPFVTDTAISFELIPPAASDMAGRMQAAHRWLVAEIDGGVAGYAYGSPHREREAYRMSCDVSVYIDPAFARRGIGRALYAALLEDMRGRGMHAAFAGITLPNDASVGLHQEMGFTSVGIYREVGWKFDRWHDVQWLQLVL